MARAGARRLGSDFSHPPTIPLALATGTPAQTHARAPLRTHTHTAQTLNTRFTLHTRVAHATLALNPPGPALHPAHGCTRLAPTRKSESARTSQFRTARCGPHALTARCGPRLLSSTPHGPLRPAPLLLYPTRPAEARVSSPPHGPDQWACHSHTTAPHTTHRPATRNSSIERLRPDSDLPTQHVTNPVRRIIDLRVRS